MIVISLFRRAAWALLAIGLAGSAAADSYHPHILKSQVVTLDANAIERHAQSGTPFDLVLGDVHFPLVLSPAPLFPKGGLPILEVGKGGVTKRIVESEITYAGDVVGEDPKSTEARFAISRGVLDGYVLSGAGWYCTKATSFSVLLLFGSHCRSPRRRQSSIMDAPTVAMKGELTSVRGLPSGRNTSRSCR